MNSSKTTYNFFLFRVPDSSASNTKKTWVGSAITTGELSVTATLIIYYTGGWKIRYQAQNTDTSQDISSSISLEEVYIKY